jgi:hypothetical protein
MHADERPQRPPPQGEERAITRELWLVRGPDPSEQDTELLHTLGAPGAGRGGFDWIAADARHQHESAAEIAAFQRQLRELTIRRAEIDAAQEEEDLRASREANKITEQEREKNTRQRSRTSTVRLLREIILLIALTWTLSILALTSIGIPITKLTPAAVLRDATNLVRDAETAIAGRHEPRTHEAPTAAVTINPILGQSRDVRWRATGS